MEVLQGKRDFQQEIDTVRALHQTVVSLRTALEQSRVEVEQLKERIWSSESLEIALQTLTLENHVLREKITTGTNLKETTTQTNDLKVETGTKLAPEVKSGIKTEHDLKIERSDDSGTISILTLNVTLKSPRKCTKCEKMEEQIKPEQLDPEKKEFDGETDEVDDIELIFTTDETTTTVIKEELVSIADGNDTPVLLHYRTIDFDAADLSGENMDDDVFHDDNECENGENLNAGTTTQMHNSKSDNSINRDKSLKSCYSSYQDSSFECRSLDKDESFDKFDDKFHNSVLVETDISKCGIIEQPELPLIQIRRNTCPNPVPYRPIMHREALANQTKRNTLAVKFCAQRPILNEGQYATKTESEAQTDISALPSFWKSESYLAHKVSHQFTTLPSKFPMPLSQKSLRLSEKTKEARRILLSDINFTSMVPELSRSADHLYQDGMFANQSGMGPGDGGHYGQYLNAPGPAQLRRYNTGDSLTSPSFVQSQKFIWSPSDYSNFSSTKFDCSNSNNYLNKYRGSLTAINMQTHSFDMSEQTKRRSYSSSHAQSNGYWRQNATASTSFDNANRYNSTNTDQGPLYRSVPNSPIKSRSVQLITNNNNYRSSTLHEFSGNKMAHKRLGFGFGFGKSNYSRNVRNLNNSLPELHGDYDSGDSTDSLVEEAEQYLRSSIDCIVSGRDIVQMTKRRSSAPSTGRDSSPPRNWKPFLPNGIKDLRCDNWVKVIGPEGKIRGGRVRYVGYVLGQLEPFVGLELSTTTGNSDGTFNDKRYFDCSSNHALFIPFKKVVMGWRH